MHPTFAVRASLSVMSSFFFEGSACQLYGCYDAPQGAARDTGVVIATAHGHEYVQFHRVFVQLAHMLAESGIPVLRFDYSGCGDSGGDPESWSLEQWGDDLGRAASELARLSGVRRIGVVGLRLGGTIACRAVELHSRLDFTVLWDPVVDGSAFLQELRDAHQVMLRYAHVTASQDAIHGEELLGFPAPSFWVDELEAIERAESIPDSLPPTLLIESNPHHSQAALLDKLIRTPDFRHEVFSNEFLWAWTEDFARVHIPIPILQAIVEGVRQQCP